MTPTSPSIRTRRRLAAVVLALSGLAVQVAAHADTLADVRARGRMVVAVDPTFSPYEFTTADGAVTGYDPDLLALVAKDLGVGIEFQKMAFDGVIPGLIAGSFDFTSTALNVTAERAKRIDYTLPVSKTQNVVLAPVGGAVTAADPDALSGRTVAVKQATQPEQLVKQVSKALVARGKAPIQVLSLQTVEQTAEALAAKRADAVVDDVAVMGEVADKSGGADRVMGTIGEPVFIAWGVRKGDDALREAIDGALKAIEADGRMKALQQKYFHTSFDLPQSGFLPK